MQIMNYSQNIHRRDVEYAIVLQLAYVQLFRQDICQDKLNLRYSRNMNTAGIRCLLTLTIAKLNQC